MRLRYSIQVAMLAALTAVSAMVSIPLGPVPFTLQSLMVPLSGALLGPAGGFLSQIVYLLLGFAGLPVFAGFSSGVGVLARPTGGFLLSFPLAAAAAGWLVDRLEDAAPRWPSEARSRRQAGEAGRGGPRSEPAGRPGFWRLLTAMILSDVVVFAIGLPWLAYFLGPAKGKAFDLYRAVEVGLLPFLATDLLKLAAAAELTARLRPVLRRSGQEIRPVG